MPNDDVILPMDHGGPEDWPYEPFPDSALSGTVVERFEFVAGRFGNRAAIGDGLRTLTYAELAAEVSRTAAALTAAIGDRPGPVAILLFNEARYAVAMLAILTCCRGYVGLDAEHPEERHRKIAEAAGAAAVISAGPIAAKARRLFGGLPVIDLDNLDRPGRDPARRARPDDIAWIVYTSGSTGEPKGVYQNQRGLLHDIMQSTNSLHLSAEDRQVLFSSPSLLSGTRIAFGSLLNGGSLYCLSPQHKNQRVVADAIQAQRITVLRSVPAVFRSAVEALAPDEQFDSLRLVHLGGDRVDWSDYLAFCRATGPDAVFGTHLSSTECSTLYLQWFLRHGVTPDTRRLPVGRAIPDREVSLVDDNGAPVPDGEIGEFAVTSRFLSLGYWNAPALTAAAYKTDPTDPAVRTFRTGDLGSRRPDGLYEHHGRKDHQIKLYGNRIEPADIEHALRMCEGVRDSAVVVRRDATGVPRALVAYVELQPGTEGLLPRHIRTMISQRLPAHMVPAATFILAQLPRLPNLKLDRVRLTALDAERSPSEADNRDPLVREIAAIFEDHLKTTGATPEDNVFSLGGDSLQAATIAVALDARFGLSLKLESEPLSIAEIAALVAASPARAGGLAHA